LKRCEGCGGWEGEKLILRASADLCRERGERDHDGKEEKADGRAGRRRGGHRGPFRAWKVEPDLLICVSA
jgi:hypothetical protein